MPRSMTGFGAGAAASGGATAAAEVRAVNNRFLKLQTRLPEGFAALEPPVERQVKASVKRGAVTVTVRLESTGSPVRYALAADVLDGYRADADAYAVASGLAPPADLTPLLALPGVVREEAADADDPEDVRKAVLAAVEAALTEFNTFRDREGAAMADELREHLATLREQLAGVEAKVPTLAEAYRHKLHARTKDLLAAAGADVSPADLTREVILYADKIDVTEEVVRLRTHLDAFEAGLAETSPGKTLDFLVQEIQREVNTVGSKANDADLAGAVVAMKGAVETLREILQNLE